MRTAAEREERKELPADQNLLLALEPLFKTVFFPAGAPMASVGR